MQLGLGTKYNMHFANYAAGLNIQVVLPGFCRADEPLILFHWSTTRKLRKNAEFTGIILRIIPQKKPGNAGFSKENIVGVLNCG